VLIVIHKITKMKNLGFLYFIYLLMQFVATFIPSLWLY